MVRPDDVPPDPRRGTAQQVRLIESFARGIRLAGAVFLALWLAVCAAMVVLSACALLGLPAGVRFGGPPGAWVGLLAGGVAGCVVGPWFFRLWRRQLDRVQGEARMSTEPGDLRRSFRRRLR